MATTGRPSMARGSRGSASRTTSPATASTCSSAATALLRSRHLQRRRSTSASACSMRCAPSSSRRRRAAQWPGQTIVWDPSYLSRAGPRWRSSRGGVAPTPEVFLIANDTRAARHRPVQRSASGPASAASCSPPTTPASAAAMASRSSSATAAPTARAASSIPGFSNVLISTTGRRPGSMPCI